MSFNLFFIKTISWIFFHITKFRSTLFLVTDAELSIVWIFCTDDFISKIPWGSIFSLFPVFN